MDTSEELQRALTEMVKSQSAGPVILPAVVTEVRAEDNVCDVLAMGEWEVFDVRLRAAINGQPSMYVVEPMVGSTVLIARIASSDEFLLLACTEIQRLHVVIGSMTFDMDATGVLIENAGISLGAKIQELITQIQAITVTPVSLGAPTPVPNNAPAFTPIASAITQILK